MFFKQSESTAARRRFPLYLTDVTDHVTPETGEAGGQPQISKNGGSFTNTSATLTAIGNGRYYVELTAAELDTLGVVAVRFKSAATIEFSAVASVVALDPFTSTQAIIEANHLDHLIAVAATGSEVAQDSLWALLHTDGDYGDYDPESRSLDAIGSYAQSLDEVDLPTVLSRLPAALTEPTGVPAATASIAQALAWLLALSRNAITQTSTTQTLKNDAGTSIATATHADDGTTYTRSEWS